MANNQSDTSKDAIARIKKLIANWEKIFEETNLYRKGADKNITKEKLSDIISALNGSNEAHSNAKELSLAERASEKSGTDSIEDILRNFSKIQSELIDTVQSLHQNFQSQLDNVIKNIISIIQDKPNNEDTEKAMNDDTQAILKWLISLRDSDTLKQNAILKTITKRALLYKFGTAKVEGTAFDPQKTPKIYAEQQVSIKVNARNSRKIIETLFSIDFNNLKSKGVNITNDDMITPYDREIHDAIATLAAAGNEYINPSMIFQLLSGNTNTRKSMSSETREKIMRSIDKMRATTISINAEKEVKAGMTKKGKYEGYLIPAERIELIELNGQKVTDCIHLFRTPPLFDYASDKNQIGSVDIKMLDAPISNTAENIALKGYLLRRIVSMKKTKSNMSSTIRYDEIYKHLGIEAPNKDTLLHKHQEIRSKVKKLLDFWVQENLIKSYKEEKEGRTIAKIVIRI